MFKCDVTGKIVGPKIPCRRIPVETRKVQYTNHVRDDENPTYWEKGLGYRIVESEGWEIVRELRVSPEGIVILAQMEQAAGVH